MGNGLVSEDDLRQMSMEELGQLALESQRIFDERLASLRGVSAQWTPTSAESDEKPRRGRKPKDRSAALSTGKGAAHEFDLTELESEGVG